MSASHIQYFHAETLVTSSHLHRLVKTMSQTFLLVPVPICLITPKLMFKRFIIICIDWYFVEGENTMKRERKKKKKTQKPIPWRTGSVILIFYFVFLRPDREEIAKRGEVGSTIQAEVALKGKHGMLHIPPSFSFSSLSAILRNGSRKKTAINYVEKQLTLNLTDICL